MSDDKKFAGFVCTGCGIGERLDAGQLEMTATRDGKMQSCAQHEMLCSKEGVQLIRDAVLDGLAGLGTGSLREHFDALAGDGAKFYLSGMSSKARGVGPADIDGKPAEMAMPDVLVKLAVEADTTITY